MRFMAMIRARPGSEAGVDSDAELLARMGRCNDVLARAGVLLAGEGLRPGSEAVRVRFSGDRRQVLAAPFAVADDLLAGFWLLQAKSLEEAIEWVKRCPDPMPGRGAASEIEIRPVLEAESFERDPGP